MAITARETHGPGIRQAGCWRQVVICLLLLAACFSAIARGASLERWIQAHAVPLMTVEPDGNRDELQAFKAVAGQAHIVGFAEATHKTHEWLALRNRVFQYLVEEAGVTAYAAETELLGGFSIDDYVMGKGRLTPELVHSVKASNTTAYEENRQLIEWIRAYNARPTTRRPVRFYGLDVNRRVLGGDPVAEYWNLINGKPMVEYALDYMAIVDVERARWLREQLGPALSSFNLAGFESLPIESVKIMSDAITEMIGALERDRVRISDKTSPLDWGRAYRAAVTARYIDWVLRAWRFGAERHRWGATPGSREDAIFDNLRWAVEREGPRGRVFLHMHEAHLDMAKIGTSTGGSARRVFGQDFVLIGGLSFASDDPDLHDDRYIESERTVALEQGSRSLAGLLYGVPLQMYLLDFRDMPAQVSNLPGLYVDAAKRSAPKDSPWPRLHPANQFDAIVVIKMVTRVHPLQLGWP